MCIYICVCMCVCVRERETGTVTERGLAWQELDPLPDVADAGRFMVERLQQTAAQAPQLAPGINQLAVRLPL